MELYNFSDMDLRIINNVINEFCNGLYIADLQSVLSCNSEKLEQILCIMDNAFNNMRFFKKWGCYDSTLESSLNRDQIKIVIKGLDEIFNYLNDGDIDTRIGYPPNALEKVKNKLNLLQNSPE